MSYSVGTEPVPIHELVGAAESIEPGSYGPEEFRQAVADHIAAAALAVAAVIESGKFQTDDAHTYGVRVSGHANPGHGDKSGWSNEFMQITISVYPPFPPSQA